MAKQQTSPKPQDKKAGKEQKAEKMFETADVAVQFVPGLRLRYEQVVRPELQRQFGYKNPMQIPRLEKIVINMGVGKGEQEPKQLENAMRDLALISGQKPVATVAKRAISNFRIRKGHRIGCKVTLRGNRMYAFLEKLINVVLPRIRDFHGLSPHSFDGRGNYSLGLREQILFPEIVYDQVDRIRGMDITICTTAETDEEALALLKALGMPFRTS
ncbi:50S ribosomal protein L5 [bacterium HR15]|uniref:50S ribosomal protein L5 n=1 Tax=uncultured prokaryote TaxID=198431 RepID=H5SJZ3_9ZZZZ|nr:50S ribosomal protein L5 [uncultured prokaryote]GBC93317.1 50S ribosomal protein L5 [bacterium HR15]